MRYLVLQGGAEFGGQMHISDQRALELAGGVQAPVHIIPAAAAPDQNHVRAGRRGQDWFRALGARDVSVSMVVDPGSANDARIGESLQQSRLIYMLGGFPVYLAEVLSGSLCWRSIQVGVRQGAVLAGSSAGAMVLCEYLFDPERKKVTSGLGILPGCCILPHHNTIGRHWAAQLRKDLPHATLVGIDEQTAMINDGPNAAWNVYGPGAVTIYHGGHIVSHMAGEPFRI